MKPPQFKSQKKFGYVTKYGMREKVDFGEEYYINDVRVTKEKANFILARYINSKVDFHASLKVPV